MCTNIYRTLVLHALVKRMKLSQSYNESLTLLVPAVSNSLKTLSVSIPKSLWILISANPVVRANVSVILFLKCVFKRLSADTVESGMILMIFWMIGYMSTVSLGMVHRSEPVPWSIVVLRQLEFKLHICQVQAGHPSVTAKFGSTACLVVLFFALKSETT